MTVFEKIEAQQKGLEDTAIWMVGEQLKDICSGFRETGGGGSGKQGYVPGQRREENQGLCR